MNRHASENALNRFLKYLKTPRSNENLNFENQAETYNFFFFLKIFTTRS